MLPDDPRHGTYAGTQAHKTEKSELCPECAHANFIYRKRMRQRLAKGMTHRVPLGADAHRILTAYTPTHLRSVTGMNRNMLSRLRSAGPTAMVLRPTRDRILAAQPTHTPIGLQRRVQALAALGYSADEMARRLGVSASVPNRLLRGSSARAHEVAQRIVNLYDEIQNVPPRGRQSSITKTKNRAARAGWVPPAAWDDIDRDPAPASAGRLWRSRQRLDLDEYEFLLSCGESPEQAAARFGVTLGAIETAQARQAKKGAA